MPVGYIPPDKDVATIHEGTEHLAFNDTPTNRALTLLALKTVARFHPRYGVCVPISKNKIVKSGPRVHLTEAATMRFVAQNTSLPIPKVYCAFVRKNYAYIVMEKIQGEVIPKAWKSLSEEARRNILSQLKKMIQELRALRPAEGTGVESCVGNSLYDWRVPRAFPRFGPFKTIQDFHQWLRQDLQPTDSSDYTCSDQEWQDIRDMVNRQDGPWPPPVFTHGDLNPFNILVRGDKVVGIIDWEFSGWYPSYWEYTSAWYTNITKRSWQNDIDKFIDPFPEDLHMESIRHKWWGAW
ncbi:hypothetical protein FQN57_000382 [Myotisia sp. PD_48]|nr:hypothetical protein FQN57_000382 [Myotisia sp. PD_48]